LSRRGEPRIGAEAGIDVDLEDEGLARRIDPDLDVKLEVAGVVGPVPTDAPKPPPGRPYSVVLALNTRLPIPAYGDYSLDLILDDSTVKTITLTTAASQVATPGAPGDA